MMSTKYFWPKCVARIMLSVHNNFLDIFFKVWNQNYLSKKLILSLYHHFIILVFPTRMNQNNIKYVFRRFIALNLFPNTLKNKNK